MRDVERNALRAAIELLHGCSAVFRGAEDVSVDIHGKRIWRRRVATYALEGHATATQAFAWTDQETQEHRVHHRVVLRTGPVRSARDAVCAFFLAESPEGMRG